MITNNTTNVVQDKAEAVHMAKISDYLLFATSKCETRDFILAVIEDTWVRQLHEPGKFYTTVAPSELLNQLHTLCGVIKDHDMLALQN